MAAYRGPLEMVRLLLPAMPASLLNKSNIDGSTPLCSATAGAHNGNKKRYENIVSLLLSAGANQVPPFPVYQDCPPKVAMQAGCEGIVRVLLKKGLESIGGAAQMVPLALYITVTECRVNVIRMLLAAEGEDKMARWAGSGYTGMTMLHHSMVRASTKVVDVLLASGRRRRFVDKRS